MKLFLLGLLTVSWHPHWELHESGVTASLRAVSVVDRGVVWGSGSGGTWLRNLGAVWRGGVVPGAEKLDFRGLAALDAHRAFLMSSGTGELSKVYATTEGGEHWTLRFTNPDAKGFFDAMHFWDARHGIILGDPVDGRFAIFTTSDGGQRWTRQPGFPALDGEGAFAASNSCLTLRGSREAWFGTGAGRILHSTDGGIHWSAVESGIRHDNASSGVFSIAWADRRHGVAVGGDYRAERDGTRTIAWTANAGRTWNPVDGRGYRSAVVWVPARRAWIATGTSGTDISKDGGRTWTAVDDASWNALSVGRGGQVWAVGANGRIARVR